MDGISVSSARAHRRRLAKTLAIDRLTLIKTRVSVASNGDPGNARSGFCALNADATIVGFESVATNLVAGRHECHRRVRAHDVRDDGARQDRAELWRGDERRHVRLADRAADRTAHAERRRAR